MEFILIVLIITFFSLFLGSLIDFAISKSQRLEDLVHKIF